MGTRKEFQGAAKATTITSALTAGSTAISISASTGWPSGASYPFVVCINRGRSNEEKVLCSSRSGTTLTVTTRGYDGTTAATHASGETIEHIIDAVTIDEANERASQPKLKLALTGSQSISDNTLTAISWDTETSDLWGFYPGSGATITVPAGYPGVYAIGAKTSWAGSPSAGEMDIYINSVQRNATITTGSNTSSFQGFVTYLAVGDTVQIYVKQTSGSALNTSGAFVWMERIIY